MKFKQTVISFILIFFGLFNFNCNESNSEGYTNILLQDNKTTLQIKLPLEFDTLIHWNRQRDTGWGDLKFRSQSKKLPICLDKGEFSSFDTTEVSVTITHTDLKNLDGQKSTSLDITFLNHRENRAKALDSTVVIDFKTKEVIDGQTFYFLASHSNSKSYEELYALTMIDRLPIEILMVNNIGENYFDVNCMIKSLKTIRIKKS
jgi:hypothetical protein